MWDKPKADWRLEQTYSLIHRMQPGTLIGSNHHKKPFDGEDFQMFEKDLPGQNTAGFNTTATYNLPLEVCMTIRPSLARGILTVIVVTILGCYSDAITPAGPDAMTSE